jgi:hypothetical protein
MVPASAWEGRSIGTQTTPKQIINFTECVEENNPGKNTVKNTSALIFVHNDIHTFGQVDP